ncbi:hypothetical protein GCM10025867_50680 (plasmid) [Frondihabitans sucicola]|uniref:LapA family protein n=1 Tax=Frondihabitans sucicola TaxID=1268041 RepID=A0ABM8GWR9_9MICO|nr:hypothetical protein [Frondihabitans sucicola]BDZ52827.1 hypothetical protein GCM10025867_50680 [Frondihabitans sucicola]
MTRRQHFAVWAKRVAIGGFALLIVAAVVNRIIEPPELTLGRAILAAGTLLGGFLGFVGLLAYIFALPKRPKAPPLGPDDPIPREWIEGTRK